MGNFSQEATLSNYGTVPQGFGEPNMPGFGVVPQPSLDQLQQVRDQAIADAVRSGQAYWTPQQLKERATNDAALAALQTMDGIPEEQRVEEMKAYRARNMRMEPLPTPPERQPLPMQAQVAQSIYQDPNGTIWERNGKNPNTFIASNHQPVWDMRQEAMKQQVGQQAGPNGPVPGTAMQQPGLQGGISGIEIPGYGRLIPKGMTLIKPHNDPTELKRQQAEETRAKERRAELDKSYKDHLELIQINKGMLPLTEEDRDAARAAAKKHIDDVEYLASPVNSKYEKWLQNHFGGQDAETLKQMAADPHAPLSAQDRRYVHDYLYLVEEGDRSVTKSTPVPLLGKDGNPVLVEGKPAMTTKQETVTERGRLHNRTENGAPEDWQEPQTRQREAPDQAVAAFIQSRTQPQMKSLIYHAAREPLMSLDQFHKRFPDQDYQLYAKAKAWIGDNAETAGPMWEQLQQGQKIEMPKVSAELPGPAVGKQLGLKTFNPDSTELAKELPVADQEEPTPLQKEYRSGGPPAEPGFVEGLANALTGADRHRIRHYSVPAEIALAEMGSKKATPGKSAEPAAAKLTASGMSADEFEKAYDSLPVGAEYQGPDGRLRRKTTKAGVTKNAN
jgi:hypothetical protein